MRKILLIVLLFVSYSTFAQKKWVDHGLVKFDETKNDLTRFGLKDLNGKIVLAANYVVILEKFQSGYTNVFNPKDSTLNNDGLLKMLQNTSGLTGMLEGLIDSTGRVIIAPIFDMILLPFKDNIVFAKKDEQDYLITKQGKVFTLEPSSINRLSTNNYYTVIANKKKGLVNRNGDFVLKPEYDKIVYEKTYYNEDLVIVTKLNKEGCYSLKGKKLLIPMAYDNIDIHNMRDAFVQVKNAGKSGLFNISTNKLALPCAYNGTIAPEYYQNPDGTKTLISYSFSDNSFMGKIDLNGKVLFEKKYLEILSTQTTKTYDLGYIKYSDKKVDSFAMGYFVYTYLTKLMKKSPFFYDMQLPDGQTNVLVQEKTKLWGLKNCLTDKYILKPDFSKVGTLRNGNDNYFIALKNNQYALFDFGGKNIIPYGIYDSISYSSPDYYYSIINVSKNSQWGCLDFENKLIVPIAYEKEIEYGDTMWVAQNGMWGCIDKDLNQLIDFKFDTEIYSDFSFEEKGIICTKSGEEIHLDKRGNEFGMIPKKKVIQKK